MRRTVSAIYRLLLVGSILILAACGNGGGDAGEIFGGQATVVLSLEGDNTAAVGSIDFDLIFPAGVSLKTDSYGDPTSNVLVNEVPDSYLTSNYYPETTLDYAQLNLAYVKTRSYISTGKVLTLVVDLASDITLPTSEEFILVNVEISDGNVIEGYSITVSIERKVAPL